MLWTPDKFHIELTNICVASCPFCPRTKKDMLSKSELSLQDIQIFFTPKLLVQIKQVHLCGSWGDPIYARDFLDIVEYFSRSGITVIISTNGFNKRGKFWSRLGKCENVCIVFGIDGITQKAHGQHRVGTELKQVLKNASLFIQSGGKAIWQFIVFGTNEHEIVRAKEVSKQLGFSDFIIRTSRAFSRDLPEPKYQFDEQGVASNTGAILCEYKERKEWYINSFGQVLPCCFLGKTEFEIPELNNQSMNIRYNSYKQIQQNAHWVSLIGKIINKEGTNICSKKCGNRGVKKQKSLVSGKMYF